VIGIHEICKGNLNSVVVRAADVFREAVRRNSAAMIVLAASMVALALATARSD